MTPFKKFIRVGAVLGAVLSISITLLMDVLYADALGGTWRDAIVRDLKTFFSVAATTESPLVIALFAVILAIMGLFGAVMGMVFGLFVYRFFSFLLKE